jgi:nitrate/nitrite transport system ATP-binding protein
VDEVLKNTTWDERISIVSKFLAMLNLTAGADKYPDEISKGMKQ